MSAHKLHPVAWNGTINNPQYQIAYATIGSQAASMARSREILRSLVGGRDLIIEMNSALLSVPEKDREAIGLAFRKGIEAHNLLITERRYPVASRPSFFARILGQPAEVEACELRALVPGSVWQSGAVDTALSPWGQRYYVLPEGTDGASLLERLNLGTIAAREVLDAMDLIIFDVANFGQMGLISTRNDQAAIQSRLA